MLSEREILETLGYHVSGVAASGQEAVRLNGEVKPDLVLMDITLNGDIDGIEAAGDIKDLYDIPIIFVTAHGSAETVERTVPIRPFGYVVKPFGRANLSSAVELALHQHRLERKLRTPLNSIIGFSEVLKEGMFGPCRTTNTWNIPNIFSNPEPTSWT